MIKFFIIDKISGKRGELFPLLKAFVKGDGFSDADRIQLYGVSDQDWQEVDKMEDADVFILSMSWNYYLKKGELPEVVKTLQEYLVYKKPIWSFTSGDFGVPLPKLKGVSVFRSNGNRSKLSEWNKGMPVFIRDPLREYYSKQELFLRAYSSVPVVGFCGQADNSLFGEYKDIARTLWRNLKHYIGIRKELPQPLYSTTHLRAQLLQYCETSSLVNTNFIRRKKYRAGAQTKEERIRTTQEFYDNIRDSDYVLCARGGGNFSVRFYETLAMGRIPVFLDTDCILPLQDEIDWKHHVVWVPYSQRHLVGRFIQDFHQALNEQTFRDLQLKNRNLWKEKLQLDGFFKSQCSYE